MPTVVVIVTGSNIPTAEEVGPNPVDTYVQRTSKNWASSAGLTTFLPQEAGGTTNLNIAWRGWYCPIQCAKVDQRNLVLVDGKRVGFIEPCRVQRRWTLI